MTLEHTQLGALHYKLEGCGFYTRWAVAYPGILFGGGGQQIELRTEDRENGDLGAVAP
jgi:hypothetical protein